MSTEEYKEDLAYLYGKLISHPLFVEDQNKLTEFEVLYSAISGKQNTFNGLIDSMNLLTGFFADGHTNIELPYTPEDKCLNIPCQWDGNRLLLNGGFCEIKKGAEILRIENVAVNELIRLMAGKIPHENVYLVKSRMIKYPYKNYHVFSQMNLAALFGDKAGYEITVLKNGEIQTKCCYLEFYNGYLDFSDNHFVWFEISGDTAVLHLDACICNDAYKSALRELVDLCDEKKIKRLILDLSKNMGGDSSVIDEFISYVDIDGFYRYEMIDYSTGTGEQITDRTQRVKNEKKKKCLNCEIYCRVSHDTFSSARTFAVTLRDNGIAKIIGSPTGGKPNSYGFPKRYVTPNNQIAFRVSRCCFKRPDVSKDDDISLFPDDESH